MQFALLACAVCLLARLAVTAHELVNATSGVDELRLTSVEGVRSARDFKLHYGVGFAFKFYGVVGLASGTREEHVAVAHVFENYGTIVLGMDSFFHFV